MGTRRNSILSATVVATGLGLAVWAGQLVAEPDGISGLTQSATGCSCHGSTATPGVVVTLSGPHMVAPGSTSSYTLTVSGGPSGSTGGFDIKATGGTLVAGTGSRIAGGELVHQNNSRRSWTFGWTAPAVAGVHNLYAVGLSSDGSGESGDDWNYSGGALNTAFAVEVNPLVDVPPLVASVSLGPAIPSPTSTVTTVQFTLPADAMVDLDVVNVAGRRVAILVSTNLSAGTHAATWNGRLSEGGIAPMGLYFVRLRAAGVERTSRVILRH